MKSNIFSGRKKDKPFKINQHEVVASARDWIRTSTSVRTPPPEDGASTNFATRAFQSLQVHLFNGFTSSSDNEQSTREHVNSSTRELLRAQI